MAFIDLFIIIVSVEHFLLFAVLSTADYRTSRIILKKSLGVLDPCRVGRLTGLRDTIPEPGDAYALQSQSD